MRFIVVVDEESIQIEADNAASAVEQASKQKNVRWGKIPVYAWIGSFAVTTETVTNYTVEQTEWAK